MITNTHIVQADKLEDIGNVNSAAPSVGDMKAFNGAEWVNVERPGLELPVAGTWGLQNNEVNAIGVLGIIDTNHTQYLGNAGTNGTPVAQSILDSGSAGGYMVSRDMRVTEMRINYRQNNIDATPWGFLIFKQVQASGINGGTGTAILDDVGNSINRAATIANRQTIVQLGPTDFDDVVISAGEMICFANRCVSTGGNRALQIRSGYIRLDYVD